MAGSDIVMDMVPSLVRGAAHGLFASGPAECLLAVSHDELDVGRSTDAVCASVSWWIALVSSRIWLESSISSTVLLFLGLHHQPFLVGQVSAGVVLTVLADITNVDRRMASSDTIMLFPELEQRGMDGLLRRGDDHVSSSCAQRRHRRQ